jgi:PhnB protein
MKTKVKAVPKGYHTVTPYLIVEGAARLIEFLKKAFDAIESARLLRPDGTVMHAQVKVGDSVVMLGDARSQWKPMPSTLYVYVNDADATFQRALQAGGVSVMEIANQFYGDRMGGVKDPVGNIWWIATRTEDVASAEMKERSEEWMKNKSKG